MSEARLQNEYDGIAFTGSFDVFHPGHRAFLASGVGAAASVASFGRIYIGLDSDATLNQRKGQISPLFSLRWRQEDVQTWADTALDQQTQTEESMPVTQQPAGRLVVISDEYRDSPRVRAAVESGTHVLFVPPIPMLRTSGIKERLLCAAADSTCLERQAGAVLLRQGVVIDTGSSVGDHQTFSHAVMNALLKAQRGDDLLITAPPCTPCAEAIVSNDISRVVYLGDGATEQSETQGTIYLKQHDVRVRQAGYHAGSHTN